MVNVWTPLVPARAANGCMQFVPGTHKLGAVPHESREYYLEIAHESLDPHVKSAVDVELDPGDVVLFQNLLFHRGQPNHSSEIRWSFDWRYQDAIQSTLRKEEGHIARSSSNPDIAVKNADEWASLTFR
jgi:ectoine hydroxylase-related dioxygenase (phytanoyl-CoA dioxygenase family)